MEKEIKGYELKLCPTCHRIGKWMQDEDEEFIVCKCGEVVEK